jgi:hypothetical protein
LFKESYMKNILWGAVFAVVFLPQMSFGANQSSVGFAPAAFVNPELTAFNQQQDEQARAFFAGQAFERGNFIKSNKDIVDKQDRRARARREGRPDPHELTAQDESTYAAFVAKQQADKAAFLSQLAQARQAFLSSQGATGN